MFSLVSNEEHLCQRCKPVLVHAHKPLLKSLSARALLLHSHDGTHYAHAVGRKKLHAGLS